MQTSFYASGFLYSPKTHQILLLQSDSENSTFWTMLGGEGNEGEDYQDAFQRIVNKLLNLKLKPKDIHPVYDYFHSTKNKPHFVFYAEVKNAKKISKLKKGSVSWFTFAETVKLPFTSQTKQDIVVGERVINAKLRDAETKRMQLEGTLPL